MQIKIMCEHFLNHFDNNNCALHWVSLLIVNYDVTHLDLPPKKATIYFNHVTKTCIVIAISMAIATYMLVATVHT